jgi:hypothetical protein
MVDITITLTADEMKALAYVAVDPVEWITNLVKNRAAAATHEIYETEVARMLADPTITTIPASKDAVVAAANVKSAAVRHAEFLATPPDPKPPKAGK